MKDSFKAKSIYNLLFNLELPEIDNDTLKRYSLTENEVYGNLINIDWANSLFDKVFIETDFNVMFTEYIKSTAKSQKINVNSLAKMIGVSRTHLSGVLNLKYNLTIDMANTLCELLKLDIDKYDLMILYYKSKKTIECILGRS